MQWTGEAARQSVSARAPGQFPGSEESSPVLERRYEDFKVIRRNGSVVEFQPEKVLIAMTKAFLAVNGGQGAA